MAGLAPIPWSSIDRYATRYGIAGEDFDALASMIRAADHEYLQIHNKPPTEGPK